MKPLADSYESLKRYDNTQIPVGYYDAILRTGKPVRRMWHYLKFKKVLDCLPLFPDGNGSLLDIGCSAGSFLSLVSESRFSEQLGVDIVPKQIDYAQAHYGTFFRKFQLVGDVRGIEALGANRFDCVSLIEVIEHLHAIEVRDLLRAITQVLKPGGVLVFSTPNYASTWPLIEFALNHFSDVTYEEQHLTRFTYFNLKSKLLRIAPEVAEHFEFEFVTTTHFGTPFLAGISEAFAARLSSLIRYRDWKMPFGNLILVKLMKRS